MPPEAVQDTPVYTEKIDCFSFGVITVQILTREFPKPGNRREEIQIDHPRLPKGTLIEAHISEVERRQNHIGKIDPNHTLLPISLDCLKDKDVERPTAQQLCKRIEALKEGPQYNERIRASSTTEQLQGRNDETERELRSLTEQHGQQIQRLQQVIQSQISQLNEKELTIAKKDQVLQQKNEIIAATEQQLRFQTRENYQSGDERIKLQRQLKDKDETIASTQQHLKQQIQHNCLLERETKQANEERGRLETEIEHISWQLKKSEQHIVQFQKQIAELEQMRLTPDTAFRRNNQNSSRASIKLIWREGERAPCGMSDYNNATIDGGKLYILHGNRVYAYTISSSSWSRHSDSPTYNCPLVIIHNLLTLVGGLQCGTITNKLFSLSEEGTWTEKFPPMQTT